MAWRHGAGVVRRAGMAAVAAGALLLCGCAGGGERGAALAPAAPGAAAAGPFHAGGAILAGFELPPAGEARGGAATWRVGDRVLLGLRFVQDGRETVRYIGIELDDVLYGSVRMTITRKDGTTREYVSLEHTTRITMYDEAGVLLAEVGGGIPSLLMDVGVYDAARVDVRTRAAGEDPASAELAEEDRRVSELGWAGVAALSSSMRENRILSDLLTDLARRPPWWRLILRPTVALNYAEPYASEAPPWSPAAGVCLPAYLVPLEMEISGEPALSGEVTVVPVRGPLALCGGLVHASVRRARDPGTHAEIRLLACRRGPAPPSRPPGAEPARADPASAR